MDPNFAVVDGHPHSRRQRVLRAAGCPGCGISLRFDLDEVAYDGPEVQDVMCALCGTVTGRDRLLAEGFDTTV
jgi:hypothetical protein